jgi:O-antigen/teichoic acid export membrane protein
MVRELVKRAEYSALDMGTAFWMTVGAGGVSLALLVAALALLAPGTSQWLYALLAGTVVVFQAFNVVDWYFQSKVQTRYVVACRVANLAISSTVKVIAIVGHAGLVTFFWIALAEQVILAIILMGTWMRLRLPSFMTQFSWTRGKELLATSWPLIFATLALTLYTRIDQIMIKLMLGDHQAGLYAAAIRIYEAWIAIPSLLSISLLPAIMSAKLADHREYQKRMVYLVRFLFYSSLAVALVVCLFADGLIATTFGPAFKETGRVLPTIMLGAAWAALGSCTMRFLIVERMERKIAFRCLVGVVISASLNYLLIPHFGIQGPALAVLLSAFATNYLVDWLDKDLRPLLKIKHDALFFSR